MTRRWVGTWLLGWLLCGWVGLAGAQIIVSPTPADPARTLEAVDHLFAGSNETGEIGEWGWAFGSSPATISGVASEVGRPAIRRLSTSATINTIAQINIDGVLPADVFDLTFWVRINQVTLQAVRIGMGSSPGDSPPDHGIYLQQDTAGANPTTWSCITRASTVETETATAVSVREDEWTIVRVLRSPPTAISIDVDGVRQCTHSTTMPSVTLQLFVQMQNLEAVAKTLDVDKVKLVFPELAE